MQTSRSRLFAVTVLFLSLLLAATGAADAKKKKKAPPEPEASAEDVTFATSFVGKNYDGDLDIEGWEDRGGGLVSPPIYVRRYQRADGTYLVLTSKELVKAKGDKPANLVVAGALVVPPRPAGTDFLLSCVSGNDGMLRYMGIAKGAESQEWWTDVRRAWEISIETGAITTIKPKGVRCTNESWGQ